MMNFGHLGMEWKQLTISCITNEFNGEMEGILWVMDGVCDIMGIADGDKITDAGKWMKTILKC